MNLRYFLRVIDCRWLDLHVPGYSRFAVQFRSLSFSTGFWTHERRPIRVHVSTLYLIDFASRVRREGIPQSSGAHYAIGIASIGRCI